MSFSFDLIGKEQPPFSFEYSEKDVILYALSVGAKKDERELLFEGVSRSNEVPALPEVLSTFGLVPSFPAMMQVLQNIGGTLDKIVHGSQKIVVKKALPPKGSMTTQAKVSGIYDYRKLASVWVDTKTKNDKDEVCVEARAIIFFMADGHFGGELPPREKSSGVIPKDKACDFSYEEKTTPEQALFYRLNGDRNPLHADPAFALSVGFERGPILHGLCTFGFLGRHIRLLLKEHRSGQKWHLLQLEGQFRKPVWPGETLLTEAYVLFESSVHLELAFVVKVKERDEVVMNGVYAKLVAL